MNHSFCRYFLITALLLAFENVLATPQPFLYGYVNDYAELLDDEAENRMDSMLRVYHLQSENHFVVLTVPEIENKSPEEFLSQARTNWFEQADDSDDKNIIILVTRDDPNVQISVGSGLQKRIPEAYKEQIVRHALAPYFRKGQYEAGVQQAIESLQEVLKLPELGNNVSFQFVGAFFRRVLETVLWMACILIPLFFLHRQKRRLKFRSPTTLKHAPRKENKKPASGNVTSGHW